MSPRCLFLIACALALAGCSRVPHIPTPSKIPFVHRIDIEQGNIVTQDMLAQLEPGMDKSKVRFIMGTPLIVDTFHTNRWDYVYSLQEGGGARQQRRVSLYFENDKLLRVEGDVKPAAGKLEVRREKAAMVDVPRERDTTLFGKLKDKVGFGDEHAQENKARESAGEAAAAGEGAPAVETAAAEGQSADVEATDAAAQAQASDEAAQADDEPKARAKKKKKGFFGRMWSRIGGD